MKEILSYPISKADICLKKLLVRFIGLVFQASSAKESLRATTGSTTIKVSWGRFARGR